MISVRYCCWACILFLDGCFPKQTRRICDIKNASFHVSCSFLLPQFYCIVTRKVLFDGAQNDPNYNPLPEDRPGGFEWGDGQPLGQQ